MKFGSTETALSTRLHKFVPAYRDLAYGRGYSIEAFNGKIGHVSSSLAPPKLGSDLRNGVLRGSRLITSSLDAEMNEFLT